MASRSLPPVIDPDFAKKYNGVQSDTCNAGMLTVRVLEDYRRARLAKTSVTTLTPAHVALAATTVMPALEYAARLGIARVQEATEERFK